MQSPYRVRVKVGDVWWWAIPCINVNGVWRPVRPWAKHFGTWRQSQ